MQMTRTFVSALVLVAALTAPLVASAQQGGLYRSLMSGKPAHAAGVLRGTIVSVDYASGAIVLSGGARVIVTPSTSIVAGKGYSALSDLHKGQTVEVRASEIDGQLVAQSIVVR